MIRVNVKTFNGSLATVLVLATSRKQVIWAKLMTRATALQFSVRRLSCSISIHFIAIHSWNLHALQPQIVKYNTKTTYFWGSRSFNVIDVDTTKKPSLMQTCAGLLKFRGSGLGQLKSTSNSENYTCRLSWFIFSHFVAIHCLNVHCGQKLQKNWTLPLFCGFNVVQVDRRWQI